MHDTFIPSTVPLPRIRISLFNRLSIVSISADHFSQARLIPQATFDRSRAKHAGGSKDRDVL